MVRYNRLSLLSFAGRAFAAGIGMFALIALFWTAWDYWFSNRDIKQTLSDVSMYYSHWAMLTIALIYLTVAVTSLPHLHSLLIGKAIILVAIMSVLFLILNGWHELITSKPRLKIEHALVPALISIHWIVFAPRIMIHWLYPIGWTLQPLLYTLIALMRGGLTGRFPYDIADTTKHGYLRVLALVSLITILSLATGYVLRAINNRMRARL